MIVGILLAAGNSTRFGEDKLLAALGDGTPMAVAAARNLVSVLPETIAVVAPTNRPLAERLTGAGAGVVVCPHAAEGMGTSLAYAVAASGDAFGWVVALADMPFLQPATIAAVVRRLEHGAGLVAPSCRGQRGHPVGFGRGFRDALTRLSGDAGARHLLQRHHTELEIFETDDRGTVVDIDTAMDLAASHERVRG